MSQQLWKRVLVLILSVTFCVACTNTITTSTTTELTAASIQTLPTSIQADDSHGDTDPIQPGSITSLANETRADTELIESVGDEHSRQTWDIPKPVLSPGPFIAVAARPYFSCGIRKDNNVVCWGNTLFVRRIHLKVNTLQLLLEVTIRVRYAPTRRSHAGAMLSVYPNRQKANSML